MTDLPPPPEIPPPKPIPPPPVIPPAKVTETTVKTVEVEAATPPKEPTSFSRKVEDGGFFMAIVLISLWCFNAILKSAGYIIGPCRNLESGFPWEFMILCAVLVVPKTIGRATAGKIWDKLPGRT